MAVFFSIFETISEVNTITVEPTHIDANHHVILYGHVEISNSMLSPLPISRWDSTGNKLSRENIQFAIVPPNPTLLEQLALRGIPTIIVCDETVPVEVILKLRSRSMTEPLSILQNPDAEEIKVSNNLLIIL